MQYSGFMLRALALSSAYFWLLVVPAAKGWAQASTAPPQGAETLRQVAGILDYIGGDYRGAVSAEGEVLSATEYAEQRELAQEADALAAKAGVTQDAPLRAQLGEIAAALRQRRAPALVSTLCRNARELIERDYGLSLAPREAPSREDAIRLYAREGCGSCHGADGSADTPAARELDPAPANFLDPERVAAVSPHRAFHAITFGVAGTAMKGYPSLTDAQRWSLAFYVLSLRHQAGGHAAGQRALSSMNEAVPESAKELYALTEEDLQEKLLKIPEESARADALAYLRAEAPFAQRSAAKASLGVAYDKLDQGLEAYRKGDHGAARQLFVSAYLDGVEPHEAGLRARDAALVTDLEKAMLALRSAAAEGASVESVEAHVRHTRKLLARAESRGANATAALIGALTITLREGLEIVLLVVALLGLVRKRGHPELARYIHAGWILAIPTGLATFWLAGSILGGMERELAEGIASIVAAVVLLGVTHWLLGQLGAKQWVSYLARRLGEASNRGAAFAVLGLSFLAAYREAFEIVLFFHALVLDAGDAAQSVWFGALLGLGLLAILATALLFVGKRLKPAPFMLASSVLLALLSLVLIGKGVRALQEAAVIEITPLSLPELPSVGLYATTQGLLAQGVLFLLLLSSAVWPWLHARRARAHVDTPADGSKYARHSQ